MRKSGRKLIFDITPTSAIIFVLWLYCIPLRWLFSWFLALVVHELGHYAAVRFFGGQIVSFQVNRFGCKMISAPLSAWQQIICIAAGPVLGFAIAVFSRWVPRIALCAFVQSIFNLLPVYPLDGGRILRLFWDKRRKRPCKQASRRVQ